MILDMLLRPQEKSPCSSPAPSPAEHSFRGQRSPLSPRYPLVGLTHEAPLYVEIRILSIISSILLCRIHRVICHEGLRKLFDADTFLWHHHIWTLFWTKTINKKWMQQLQWICELHVTMWRLWQNDNHGYSFGEQELITSTGRVSSYAEFSRRLQRPGRSAEAKEAGDGGEQQLWLPNPRLRQGLRYQTNTAAAEGAVWWPCLIKDEFQFLQKW